MKIQSYSKKELAIAYAPDITVGAAVNKLVHWINMNPDLSSDLAALGYHKQQKIFTMRMVEKIFYYLGEP